MIPTPIPCLTYVLITSASVAVKTTFAFKPLSKKALSRSLLPVNPKTYVTMGNSAKCLSFGLFKTSLEEIALHAFLNNELKSIDLLSNFVGVLMIPTPISGKFISINKNELESIPNVSGVEITAVSYTHLTLPTKA